MSSHLKRKIMKPSRDEDPAYNELNALWTQPPDIMKMLSAPYWRGARIRLANGTLIWVPLRGFAPPMPPVWDLSKSIPYKVARNRRICDTFDFLLQDKTPDGQPKWSHAEAEAEAARAVPPKPDGKPLSTRTIRRILRDRERWTRR